MAGIFEARGRMAYGIARAMLRDVHEAEDATQQAFLSAYGALLRGAHVRDEAAWIATIVRNECRARIAAAMRVPPALADEDLDALAAPGDEAERRLQGAAICSALAGLPDRQREAVLLRDLYGLRYGEVATALGLSRPATEALLFRARRALRLRLRPALGAILVLPASMRDAIAEVIPGFPALGTGGAASAGALGLLAKLGAAPVATKLATAAVAVTTVGAVGAVETHHARRQPPVASALAPPSSTGDERGTSDGLSAPVERETGAREDRSGRSGRRDDGADGGQTSGHDDGSGSGSLGRGGDGATVRDDGGLEAGGSSSTSGPGAGDTVADGDGSGDSGSSSSGSSSSDTEPAGPSGSSGPSESSGSSDGPGDGSISEEENSAEVTATLEETSSASDGSGSGGDGSSGSGDSGSSGSGDTGSGDSGSGGSGEN